MTEKKSAFVIAEENRARREAEAIDEADRLKRIAEDEAAASAELQSKD